MPISSYIYSHLSIYDTVCIPGSIPRSVSTFHVYTRRILPSTSTQHVPRVEVVFLHRNLGSGRYGSNFKTGLDLGKNRCKALFFGYLMVYHLLRSSHLISKWQPWWSQVPFSWILPSINGGFHSHGDTPSSLDVLFQGKSYRSKWLMTTRVAWF